MRIDSLLLPFHFPTFLSSQSPTRDSFCLNLYAPRSSQPPSYPSPTAESPATLTSTMCPSCEPEPATNGNGHTNGHSNGNSNGTSNGQNGSNREYLVVRSCARKPKLTSSQPTLASLPSRPRETPIPSEATHTSQSAISSAMFPTSRSSRAPFERVSSSQTHFLIPRRRSRSPRRWMNSVSTT